MQEKWSLFFFAVAHWQVRTTPPKGRIQGLCSCVPGSMDNEEYSPLHVASSKGHRAIIVALVEEGGADVNIRGGEREDTPLMLSVRNIVTS